MGPLLAKFVAIIIQFIDFKGGKECVLSVMSQMIVITVAVSTRGTVPSSWFNTLCSYAEESNHQLDNHQSMCHFFYFDSAVVSQ